MAPNKGKPRGNLTSKTIDMMKDDLEYHLCRCGKIHYPEIGIIGMIQDHCLENQITYRPGKFSTRHLHQLFGDVDPMKQFKDLLNFTHFKPMPNYESSTLLERKIYSICRESDIRSMKRLRIYIEEEEDFNSKY